MTSVPTTQSARPEIWGGIECTVNRVSDRYFDQLHLTGHCAREDDLDRVAELGIRTLRYPVLWERIEVNPGEFDWEWTDRRLTRLRELGIEPIVTLVHHGSGPRWTSLLEDSFVDGLVQFARAVAERYPWVRRYTVVNEPLTTARFSGLYGVWYPHGRDDRLFVRALLNECRATVLAMAEIQRVSPEAISVQTEDMGRVSHRPALAERAAFYNARRWLSLDLLCGRVGPGHSMWNYLRHSGATEDEMQVFQDYDGTPGIIGMNYYVTSDRFLDDRIERYPDVPADRSMGDEPAFVDVETVRLPGRPIAGHERHLRAMWKRYGVPVAITEAHLGGPPEQQVRWLRDAWHAAQRASADGIPVPAVAVWSLFGSCDWNRLVVDLRGHYEPGAFDVRGGRCRPTAIARAVRDLASGREIQSPAAVGPGWWDRGPAVHASKPERVLITGRRGTLGAALERACRARGLDFQAVARADLDITDPEAVHRVVREVRPWAIVNAAGYVRVDDAEHDESRCRLENVDGVHHLAAAAAEHDARLLTFSSDLVFDGSLERPYVETDSVSPLSAYGRSKADAEQAALSSGADALVIRTAAFFGPWDTANTVSRTLAALSNGERCVLPADAVVSPTYVPDLADASLDLLVDGERGVFHLANAGAVSWFDLGRTAAERLGVPISTLQPCVTADLKLTAPRPLSSALATERGALMPTLDSAIERYAREVETLPGLALSAAG